MTESPRPEPPRTPWIPGAGAAALGALAAYALGVRIQGSGPCDADVVVLAVLLLAGVVVTLRRRDRPAEACGLALGFAAAAPALWLATVATQGLSLTFDRMLESAALRFVLVFAVPALLFATMAVGRYEGRKLTERAGRRAAWVLRGAAWAAMVGAVALLVAWGVRARRPTAPAYVASLPVVASFDEVDRSRYAPPVEHGGGGIVRRAMLKGRCWIGGEDDPPPADGLVPLHEYWELQTCGPLVVRSDARRSLLVAQDARGHRVALDRARGWMPTRLPPTKLAGSVRPPDSFAVLALLGLAGALVALLWPRRSRLPADESACRDAELLADGMLRVGDETLPPADAHGVVGPVVAVLGTPAESFREHAGPVVLAVVPGTIAEHRFGARVGAAAIALALVVVACTPLLTALACLQ